MNTELIASAHAVGESNYHIQLTPAYRRDIFSDPLVAELTISECNTLDFSLGGHFVGRLGEPLRISAVAGTNLRATARFLCGNTITSRYEFAAYLLEEVVRAA